MSAKSHRSDYIILLALGTFAAAVIFALIAWGWIREDADTGPAIRTTHATNEQGTMACYMLFERLGIEPRRSEDPLREDTLAQMDLLVLLNPVVPLHGGELALLKQWVTDGGVLICDGGTAAALWGPKTGPACQAGWVRTLAESDSRPNPSLVRPAGSAEGLTRDVAEVRLATKQTIDPADILADKPAERVESLLTDASGLRIAACRHGAGVAIALADDSFLANGWIGESDNAILAANLATYALSHARGRQVTFDEYHFGYGRRQTGWTAMTAMLFQTSAGWAVLAAAAAGGLFLTYRGRRFGTRRAPSRTRRRSKLEYVYSVGATYRAAGAHRLTLQLIYSAFRGRCAASTGLPESAPADEVAAALARRTGRPVGPYREAFGACEAAIGDRGRLSAGRLSALLNLLAKVESEIAHGHSTRK